MCCKSISLQSHWYTMQGSFFLSGLHIVWFLKWPFHAPLSIEPLPTLKGTKDYYKKIKYCYLKLRKLFSSPPLQFFVWDNPSSLCLVPFSLLSWCNGGLELPPFWFTCKSKKKESRWKTKRLWACKLYSPPWDYWFCLLYAATSSTNFSNFKSLMTKIN